MRTAETIGGICSLSPSSALAASATASGVRPAMSNVRVTSPAESWVEVAVPRVIVAS